MLADGIITEYDMPVGTLKYKGRARIFLRDWERENNKSQEEKGYERICELHRIICNDSNRMSRKGEGHVGDFLDALAGNAEEEKEDSAHAEYIHSVWKEFGQLGEKYYSYARCVGDIEILSLIKSVIGYEPIC